MRIAIVSREYPPETPGGGVGTQARAKAHGLAALGHDVVVVSRSLDDRRHEKAEGPVRVVRIPSKVGGPAGNTLEASWVQYSIAVAETLDSLHGTLRLDVVEFPEWGNEAYYHLLNRAEWNWLPTAIQLHGPLVLYAHTTGWPDPDSELFRIGSAMEGTCLRLADGVYSSSAYSAKWCAEAYGLNRDAIPVLHTGVDVHHFTPGDGRKADRPTVAFVGRISNNKGADVLFDACCLLAREFRGLRLRILGNDKDDLLTKFRAKAAVLGLGDLLELPGFVPHGDLPGILVSAHVFALPAPFEAGPGLVNLEAMACGLPVVVAAGNGAAEIIEEGRNGLLAPPGDAKGLADSLGRLLANPSLREEMGRQAREYVLEHAEQSACLRRIEAFLTACSQQGARVAP